MANMDQWKDRLERLWSRLTTVPSFTLRYRHLVKTGFWVLAFVWMFAGGSWIGIDTFFEADSPYVQRQHMSRCKALDSPSARFNCISAFIINRDNAKFTKVVVTFLPALFLIPVYRATYRRMGERAEKVIEIAWD